jgi:ElaB/YqjD/DUF883 family membrane-anchored ribosome-binding protein
MTRWLASARDHRSDLGSIEALIEDLQDRLGDFGHRARRGSRHGVRRAHRAAHSAGDTVLENVGEALAALASRARSGAADANRLGARAAREIGSHAEGHPFAAIAVAFGLGLAVGFIARREWS